MKLSRYELYKLLAVGAFPIHIWVIFWLLNDYSWISQDIGLWDTFGVFSYSLVVAFLESLFLLLIMVCFCYLLPSTWEIKKKISFVGLLILILMIWGMAGQSYLAFEFSLPEFFWQTMIQSSHPLWVLYGSLLFLVLASIGLPTMIFLSSKKFVDLVDGWNERLVVLASFYFFLDLLGLVIVLARNV